MHPIYVEKVLFDLDGTLIDTARDLHAATNHCLKLTGRKPVDFELLRHLTGHGAIRLIEEGLKQTGGVADVCIETLRKDFLKFYAENICVESRPYDGAMELLNDLDSKKIPYAICSNKPFNLALSLLDQLGLTYRFATITGGDSFTARKPDPDHLWQTARRLPGADRFVMVGDASPDIKAAKAAGIPAIVVDYGYPDVALTSLEPDLIISDMRELIPVLQRYEP